MRSVLSQTCSSRASGAAYRLSTTSTPRPLTCCAATHQQGQVEAPLTACCRQAAPLAAGVAAALLQLSVASSSLAAPTYGELPGFGAGTPFNQVLSTMLAREQQQGPSVDELYDENLMTVELKTFVNDVMNNKFKPEQYPTERLKMGFKRELDGRVSVRSRDNKWYRVKNDMEAPGFLLLQDPMGYVYFLPPDDDGLEQVDLSDDIVVAQLFSISAWQDAMIPLRVLPEGQDAVTASGAAAAKQLQLSELEFRSLMGLMGDALEADDDLDAAPELAQ